MFGIGSKDKRKGGLKGFAKSLGSKVNLTGWKKDGDDTLGSPRSRSDIKQSRQTAKDADPGVVSDDEDFTFEVLSHESSENSPNQHASQSNNVKIKVENPKGECVRRHMFAANPTKPLRTFSRTQDEWELKLSGNKSRTSLKPNGIEAINRRSWDFPTLFLRIEEENDTDVKRAESEELVSPSQKERASGFSVSKSFRKEKSESDLKKAKSCAERIIIARENKSVPIETNATNSSRISNELIQKFQGKSKEELVLMACELQSDLDYKMKKLKELEDVLVRVIETTSKLLQNPIFNAH